MSADVAGYSRLMGDDERATMDTLNAYRDVFRKHISDHDGRVVDTAGDSVLAVFASVVEAVQCAVEVQGELKQRNANLLEARQMRFRIGMAMTIFPTTRRSARSRIDAAVSSRGRTAWISGDSSPRATRSSSSI